MIIINSDDFGNSLHVNRATFLAYDKHLISSVTTLVNKGEGLGDAVDYVESGKIHRDAVGIHLNLTSGEPLTDPIRTNSTFCENGLFRPGSVSSMMYLDKQARECAYRELDAQINHFVASFGFPPSHIDSHHHIHNGWALCQIVKKLALAHKIGSIRRARNLGRPSVFPIRAYKSMLNRKMNHQALRHTDKFGDINDLIYSGIDPGVGYEIMAHAGLAADGVTILDMDGIPLELKLQRMLTEQVTDLYNYHEFRRQMPGGRT